MQVSSRRFPSPLKQAIIHKEYTHNLRKVRGVCPWDLNLRDLNIRLGSPFHTQLGYRRSYMLTIGTKIGNATKTPQHNSVGIPARTPPPLRHFPNTGMANLTTVQIKR
ncbi:hypothetical protein O3G_MSEX000378 [Manduca sexta]|nr:hypothetical protein O3G_MSEX000378 [Manduca sexta]